MRYKTFISYQDDCYTNIKKTPPQLPHATETRLGFSCVCFLWFMCHTI